MAVTITLMATNNLGTITSPDGKNITSWRTVFHIDGPDFVSTEISIPIKGVSNAHDARQQAVKYMQRFLSEAYATAKNYEL